LDGIKLLKLKIDTLIVNNVRFLILPWIRIQNLASKILSSELNLYLVIGKKDIIIGLFY